MEEVRKNVLDIEEIKREISKIELLEHGEGDNISYEIENLDTIKGLFENNYETISETISSECKDGKKISEFFNDFFEDDDVYASVKALLLDRLFNEVVESKTQPQQELLNTQPEQTEEAIEEKSEQEKSLNAQELLQEQPLPGQNELANAQEQQTLEPTNQNVPVMLNVAEQPQDAQKELLEKVKGEEAKEKKSEAEQKGNMEKEDIESMMEARQRLIEGRVNKINNDVKYLIDPTKINRIQRFVKSESVDYNTQEAFANMSLSFNSMLREEISVLHVENSVLLEEKRRLNMELSAYKKMCESKNAEIMSDNIKIKEVNIKTSARLKFIKDSIEEQVKNDTDFRQLVMAKYNEVQYNEPEKEITEEQKQQEMQNDKQLFDDTYNKFKSTEQNFMNRFINLRSELLALTGAIKSVEEDKNKGLK